MTISNKKTKLKSVGGKLNEPAVSNKWNDEPEAENTELSDETLISPQPIGLEIQQLGISGPIDDFLPIEEELEEEPEEERKPRRKGVELRDETKRAERALLIGAEIGRPAWPIEDSLNELASLAETAGVIVVGTVIQKMESANPATFIGKGKVEEVRGLVKANDCDTIIFDEELTPGQLRNLEGRLDMKVLDRTALVLDIFAQRAQTYEGRLQVELAQLEYRLPRLTKMWTHLSRQTGSSGGAGVGVRGPGETQLEVDRRRSRSRIAQLKKELENVRTHRELYRRRRHEEGIPVIALVGYTNAGKSTLLNILTNATVLAENKLFATLDPTTRQLKLGAGQEILLTDTVGFIQRLPTQLVAAFRATLEEVNDADLLLHVLDITHPNAAQQAQTVQAVLKELGAGDKPQITVLNKIDAIIGEDLPPTGVSLQEHLIEAGLDIAPDYVAISAAKGYGLEELRAKIEESLKSELLELDVTIPYNMNNLVAIFHNKGSIKVEEYGEGGTIIKGHLPQRYERIFAPYKNN